MKREEGEGGGEDGTVMHIASHFQISHDGRQLIKDHFTSVLQLSRARERYYRYDATCSCHGNMICTHQLFSRLGIISYDLV